MEEKKENVRKIAYDTLKKCGAAEQYSNIAVDTVLKRTAIKGADRGLLVSLVYGTIERQITLDAQIDRLANKSRDVEWEIRVLLRMGLYQLAFLDRVPDHAAVNETVNLAPKRAKGFVNALLHSFIREGKEIRTPDRAADPTGYLSVKYSISAPVCAKFTQIYGVERTESIFAAMGGVPATTLSVNRLKIARADYLRLLSDAGIDAEPTKESGSGVRVGGVGVAELPGFDEGYFFVQDEASQLCCEAVEAAPGMSFLDVCACPGSKTFGVAIGMEDRGEVISCDLHRNKLSLISGGAERLGLCSIRTEARDARDEKAEWLGKFDRVLCDVPCSGFGVMAKKPELRSKDPEKSRELPAIQSAILSTAAGYVKPGGRLIYSTCTLFPEENGENVRRFLEQNSAFTLLRERTLFPDTDGTDGFYFAVMERR